MARNPGVMVLETEDVAITTATISIRTLQVNKRQLTLAVFRQLPEMDLVDETALALRGVPWGHVRYHWGDISSWKTHFVIQQGNQLFRAPFSIRDSDGFHESSIRPLGLRGLMSRGYRLAEALVRAQILEGRTPEDPAAKSLDCYFDIPGTSLDLGAGSPAGASIFWEPVWLYYSSSDVYQSRQAIAHRRKCESTADELRRHIAEACGGEIPAAEIEGRIRTVIARIIDYCDRWDDLMAQLRGVEQLFIAT